MSKKSPSERRHGRTRQAILDAALAIINQQGVDGLSMRTLAEEVDYSPSALYNYFDNKEEIVEAIRAEGWALFDAMDQGSLQGDLSPAELLYRSGLAYLKFAETYPDHYLLMMSPSDRVPESLEEFMQWPNFKELADSIEAMVASGDLKVLPGYTSLHLAFLVWFVVHGIAMLKLTLMRDCRPEFDEISARVMRAAVDVFTAA
ncbi:MAG: TetR/AcrR family transcriptional regulator [Anaerolineae bacterium]|nr:TetR/AcrR family transcriptional regulator [Anaerolineae bacterium]